MYCIIATGKCTVVQGKSRTKMMQPKKIILWRYKKMRKFEVYYCYMIDGVWEHKEIVEAETWHEARRAVLDKLGLRSASELDFISDREIEKVRKVKKVTAKVAYRDKTHKELMYWYNIWMGSYKYFIEKKNERMVDFEYERLFAATDLLYFAGCINHERKKYMEHEVDKMRGWA